MAFFQQHRERAYTVEEIVSLLEHAGSGHLQMGRSTVYRLISEFASDGMLHRFSLEGERSFRYQYMGDPACAEHLHMKCTHCGELFHLGRALSEDIHREIWQSVGLSISKEENILLGTCKKCGAA